MQFRRSLFLNMNLQNFDIVFCCLFEQPKLTIMDKGNARLGMFQSI